MIVPSHFVPLAAPGMVALGIKWMWNPESPFYIKPRFDPHLLRWGWNFWRAANPGRVARAAPLLRDLHLASRGCFEEFAASGEDFGLTRKGLLMLCKTERALEEEAALALKARELGVPAEVIGPRQIATLDPGARVDVAGAVYFPKDCHLTPSRFMDSLQRSLERAGVSFLWNTEIAGWRTGPSRIETVRTNHGELTAEEFVLAGGVWSEGVAASLGLRLPMEAGKGYSVTLPKPRESPQICSILCEARVAVTPMDGQLRVGGTMEIAGLDESINQRRVNGILKALPRYYPAFQPEDFRGLPAWSGLRPCSPDGLPYLGRARRYNNLVVATGHAMMGVSLGPISGLLAAELLSNDNVPIDISLLNPDRYN